MAASDHDPLLLLRQSIASSNPSIPTASEDPDAAEVSLEQATHLQFSGHGTSLPIDAPTRFNSNDKPVDLRSIYFAWLNRELAIPEYNASATTLNEKLNQGKVQNLGFIERLDLITWLEGASEESEYIKPLAGDAEGLASAAAAGGLAAGGKPRAATSTAQARSGKGVLGSKQLGSYNGERRMGDRNTVLRGVKPTVCESFWLLIPDAHQVLCCINHSQDFSHVRKLAAPFIQKKSHASSLPATSVTFNQKTPSRRPDPIILLSPSASSLMRMSNARSFLEDGKFVPPEAGASAAGMLHVQRLITGIDANRPMRFILVEGPEQFKPEYWNRVVAVFTTGQTWQFKNYKWSNPNDLFKHTIGIYIGWRGDQAPDNVHDWGRRVVNSGVDRWRGEGHVASRFRDKEVVEHIWKSIETNMLTKGWKRDAAPSSI